MTEKSVFFVEKVGQFKKYYYLCSRFWQHHLVCPVDNTQEKRGSPLFSEAINNVINLLNFES